MGLFAKIGTLFAGGIVKFATTIKPIAKVVTAITTAVSSLVSSLVTSKDFLDKLGNWSSFITIGSAALGVAGKVFSGKDDSFEKIEDTLSDIDHKLDFIKIYPALNGNVRARAEKMAGVDLTGAIEQSEFVIGGSRETEHGVTEFYASYAVSDAQLSGSANMTQEEVFSQTVPYHNVNPIAGDLGNASVTIQIDDTQIRDMVAGIGEKTIAIWETLTSWIEIAFNSNQNSSKVEIHDSIYRIAEDTFAIREALNVNKERPNLKSGSVEMCDSIYRMAEDTFAIREALNVNQEKQNLTGSNVEMNDSVYRIEEEIFSIRDAIEIGYSKLYSDPFAAVYAETRRSAFNMGEDTFSIREAIEAEHLNLYSVPLANGGVAMHNEAMHNSLNSIPEDILAINESAISGNGNLAIIRELIQKEFDKEVIRPEIHIEINNTNTINSELDMDEIIHQLTVRLKEALCCSAEGIYL